MKSKGSITQLPKNRRPGYIRNKDGRMVVFDAFSLQGLDPAGLYLGDWVEYEDVDWNEGRRALIVKPMIGRAEE
jgi:hypothetical protein